MESISIKKTYALFVIYMISYIAISIAAQLALPVELPFWCTLIMNNLLLLFPVVVMVCYYKINVKDVVRSGDKKVKDFIFGYVGAYTLMPLIYLINYITMFFSQNHVNDMINDITQYPLVLQLFLIAFLPATIEEIVFRGFFYGLVKRHNVMAAAVVSGIFFGVAHMNINQFAYAFVIGVLFCILYEVTGNLCTSVAAHFAINANTVIMANLNPEAVSAENTQMVMDTMKEMPLAGILIVIIVLAVAAAVGIGLFMLILNHLSKEHGTKEFIAMQFKKIFEKREEKFVNICFGLIVPFLIYMILLEL